MSAARIERIKLVASSINTVALAVLMTAFVLPAINYTTGINF